MNHQLPETQSKSTIINQITDLMDVKVEFEMETLALEITINGNEFSRSEIIQFPKIVGDVIKTAKRIKGISPDKLQSHSIDLDRDNGEFLRIIIDPVSKSILVGESKNPDDPMKELAWSGKPVSLIRKLETFYFNTSNRQLEIEEVEDEVKILEDNIENAITELSICETDTESQYRIDEPDKVETITKKVWEDNFKEVIGVTEIPEEIQSDGETEEKSTDQVVVEKRKVKSKELNPDAKFVRRETFKVVEKLYNEEREYVKDSGIKSIRMYNGTDYDSNHSIQFNYRGEKIQLGAKATREASQIIIDEWKAYCESNFISQADEDIGISFIDTDYDLLEDYWWNWSLTKYIAVAEYIREQNSLDDEVAETE